VLIVGLLESVDAPHKPSAGFLEGRLPPSENPELRISAGGDVEDASLLADRERVNMPIFSTI
jgi:hypothetical protein